jgi:hypothetical protein
MSAAETVSRSSSGGSAVMLWEPHFSHRNPNDFLASFFLSSVDQSSEAIAPSPRVGMNAMRASNTVRIVHDGRHVSS